MREHILSKRSSMHAITMQSLLAVGEACCSGWMRLNINQFWMWSQSCVVANPHINWGMPKQVSNSLMFAIGLQSPYRCMWRWFMNRLLPARSQTCINERDLECRYLIAKHFWNGYASCCWVSLTLTDCKTQSWVWATYWWDVQDCYRLKNLGQTTQLVVVNWLVEIELQVGSESHLHPRTDVNPTPYKPGCQRSSQCIGLDWGNLDKALRETLP